MIAHEMQIWKAGASENCVNTVATVGHTQLQRQLLSDVLSLFFLLGRCKSSQQPMQPAQSANILHILPLKNHFRKINK